MTNNNSCSASAANCKSGNQSNITSNPVNQSNKEGDGSSTSNTQGSTLFEVLALIASIVGSYYWGKHETEKSLKSQYEDKMRNVLIRVKTLEAQQRKRSNE